MFIFCTDMIENKQHSALNVALEKFASSVC